METRKPETQELRAVDELKKMREEVRAKVKQLGKEAGEVIKEAEELLKLIEVKLATIGELALKDTQQAIAAVGVKLQALKKKVEQHVKPAAKPPGAPPPAKV